MSTGLRVTLDDVEVTCHAWAPLSVKWGREHPGDSFDPRRCAVTFDDIAKPRRGQTLVAILADPTATPDWAHAVGLWSAAVGSWNAQRVSVVIFRGKITDTQAAWSVVHVHGEEEQRWGAVVDVVAVDPMSELVGQNVGDAPWPQETVSARATRIQALTPLTWSSDASSAIIAARDVDAQPAYDLLDDLAHMASISGGLWYDPNTLTARFLLGTARNSLVPSMTLDACSIGADAVSIVDATDVVNDVSVQYVNPADPTAQPSAHAVQVGSVNTYGRRGRSISTELISATDAQARAQSEAVRFGVAVERWQEIHLGTKYGTVSTALAKALIQAGPSVRCRLTSLPAPAASTWDGYVEGWELTVDSASWDVGLNLSPATWSGPLLTWADVPSTQRWADVIRPYAWQDALALLPSTISEPEFEDWTGATSDPLVPDGLPVGWVTLWITGPRGVVRKGVPYLGSSSLRWDAPPGSGSATQRILSTAWPVQAGATIDVAVVAERRVAVAATIELDVMTAPHSNPFPFAPNAINQLALAATALTSGWVTYTGSVVVPAGHTFASMSVVLAAAAGSGASALIDSVQAN